MKRMKRGRKGDMAPALPAHSKDSISVSSKVGGVERKEEVEVTGSGSRLVLSLTSTDDYTGGTREVPGVPGMKVDSQ